jgi:hypothetical protein
MLLLLLCLCSWAAAADYYLSVNGMGDCSTRLRACSLTTLLAILSPPPPSRAVSSRDTQPSRVGVALPAAPRVYTAAGTYVFPLTLISVKSPLTVLANGVPPVFRGAQLSLDAAPAGNVGHSFVGIVFDGNSTITVEATNTASFAMRFCAFRNSFVGPSVWLKGTGTTASFYQTAWVRMAAVTSGQVFLDGTAQPVFFSSCQWALSTLDRGVSSSTGGAAITMLNTSSLLWINASMFSNLHTTGPGGALLIDTTNDVYITASFFQVLNAFMGGAVFVRAAHQVFIWDTLFRNNIAAQPGASAYGGAIAAGCVSNCIVTIDSSTFRHNSADAMGTTAASGGALAFPLGSGTVTMAIANSYFWRNSANDEGGAVFVAATGFPGQAVVGFNQTTMCNNTACCGSDDVRYHGVSSVGGVLGAGFTPGSSLFATNFSATGDGVVAIPCTLTDFQTAADLAAAQSGTITLGAVLAAVTFLDAAGLSVLKALAIDDNSTIFLLEGAIISVAGELVVGSFSQLTLTNVTVSGTYVVATYQSITGMFSSVTVDDGTSCPPLVSNVVQGSQSLSVTVTLQQCATTSPGSGLSGGAIAGIVVGSVVGSVVGVAIVVAAVVGAVLHKRRTASQISFAKNKLSSLP